MIDQHVGRGAVLEEAINEAVPGLYGDAVREQEIEILGHPEIEVTKFNDGEELVFTAEVDVRPEIELPDYDGLPVTVDDAEFNDDEIAEQLQGLRDRFATLAGVERAAATGDYVSIDLSATVDGEAVEDASASNLSYEVGSDSLVERARRGDRRTVASASPRSSRPSCGPATRAARRRQATVTVRSVKEKQVPELDDEFAQTASEFDTIDELRADIRERMTRIKALTQGVQARDKVLETLLEKVDVPMPAARPRRRGHLPQAAARPAAARGRPDQGGLRRVARARPPRSSTRRSRTTPARRSRRSSSSTRSPRRKSWRSTRPTSPTRSSAAPSSPGCAPTSTRSRSSTPASSAR